MNPSCVNGSLPSICSACRTRLGHPDHRGLCNGCYRNPEIRHRHGTRIKQQLSKPRCVHCRYRVGMKWWGLCARCYGDLDVRVLYAPTSRPQPSPGVLDDDPEDSEHTLEELEAMVKARMKQLPKWWHDEVPFGLGDE